MQKEPEGNKPDSMLKYESPDQPSDWGNMQFSGQFGMQTSQQDPILQAMSAGGGGYSWPVPSMSAPNALSTSSTATNMFSHENASRCVTTTVPIDQGDLVFKL